MLALTDNMAVALIFGRYRARDFRLLAILRKCCAWLLLRNVQLHVRWVPSELNPSDEGTRSGYETAAQSKTLVDVLQQRHDAAKAVKHVATAAVHDVSSDAVSHVAANVEHNHDYTYTRCLYGFTIVEKWNWSHGRGR